MNFEQTYRRMNDRITPSDTLVSDTLTHIHQRQRPKRRLRRGLLTALIAALLLGCITPALAANIPVVYQALYMFSPALAQQLMPVNESCEDNGVKMEVVSAAINGDTAMVYLSLQDLIGDRFDETVDLFDSYHLNFPSRTGVTGHCDFVSYDEETRTALFLVTLEQSDGAPIPTGKYTFSVRQLLSGKQTLEDITIPLSLADASIAPETLWIDAQSRDPYISGGSAAEAGGLPESARFLAPQAPLYEPADNLAITGMGWIDGQLHVQLRIQNSLRLDPHGWLNLKTASGETIHGGYTLYFTEHPDADDRTNYHEFIFDVTPEQAADYILYGSFYTASNLTEGNWQVTFRLEDK